MLVINCKTYGTTQLAIEIAQASKKVLEERRVQKKKKITIAVAVPATEIYRVASLGIVPVFSEHMDAARLGAHTGRILAEDVKDNGAVGTLLNHSEYQHPHLIEAIQRAKEVGLQTIVCARTVEEAKEIMKAKPDYIAVEPPELIGGDVSISSARPELITSAVQEIKVPVLVGAGVKTTADVSKAISLGAQGILVASGITKSKNFFESIKLLANGY